MIMKIKRIDYNKNLNVYIEQIEISLPAMETDNGAIRSFTITCDSRGLLIHKREGLITIRPGCSNEIYVK